MVWMLLVIRALHVNMLSISFTSYGLVVFLFLLLVLSGSSIRMGEQTAASVWGSIVAGEVGGRVSVMVRRGTRLG